MSWEAKEHVRTMAFQLGRLVHEVEIRADEDQSMSRQDIIEYFRTRIGDIIELNLPPFFLNLYNGSLPSTNYASYDEEMLRF